jgi:hypothetical protein
MLLSAEELTRRAADAARRCGVDLDAVVAHAAA